MNGARPVSARSCEQEKEIFFFPFITVGLFSSRHIKISPAHKNIDVKS